MNLDLNNFDFEDLIKISNCSEAGNTNCDRNLPSIHDLAKKSCGISIPAHPQIPNTLYNLKILKSLFITHYSLLATHYSLLATRYSLLATRYSLLATYYSLNHKYKAS